METETSKLKILHLEDDLDDVDIIEVCLRKAAIVYELKVVKTKEQYKDALNTFRPTIIFSDNKLPGFDAVNALEILKQSGVEIPFILVTGSVSEEYAAETIKLGASDYILKDHLHRLPSIVNKAIERSESERNRKLEELKRLELENQYSHLMHSLPVAFYTCDKDGNILLFNHAAVELWGRIPTRETDKWSGAFKTLDPDKNPILPEESPMAVSIRKSIRIEGEEIIIEQPEGALRNVLCYPSPMFNSAGTLIGGANVLVDITEAKNTELLYHRANKLARLGSWEFDISANHLYWSEITKEIHEVPYDYEADVDTAIHFYKEGYSRDMISKVLAESMQTGKPWDVELQIVTSKNNTKWVRAIGEAKFLNGQCSSISGSFQDIDERKRAENELRKSEANLNTIFSNIDISFILLDSRFNIISCNRTANIWAKFAFGSAFKVGDNLVKKVGEEKKQLALDNMNYVLSGASIDRETKYEMLNGDTKWYRIKMNPIKEKKGPIIGICISASDITESKLTEQEILHKNEQLKNLTLHLENVREEERAIISREIHDELGQQITALKMDIDWVKYKQTNPEKAVVQKLGQMLELTSELVNSIRRICSDLRPAIIDDLGLLDALQWKCKDFEKKTELNCSFTSAITEQSFDKKFSINVYRILQETLTNVARHSKATAVAVYVSENDDSFLMDITDNGIGISKENAENEKTLGILGMKERAALFGGELLIEGLKNKGTSTKLILPKSK